MMRRRIGRPGLIGTAARTAVIAGTATAVSGGMQRRGAAKADQAAQAQAMQEQQAAAAQQQAVDAAVAQALAAQQAQAQQAQAQQAQAQQAQTPGGGDDVVSRLERLAALKAQGILTDEEFAAQKAKILGM